jgi:glycosyltransferase involved in cell wall biosynthesis
MIPPSTGQLARAFGSEENQLEQRFVERLEMRILFVAMANSIHTARWLSQLNGQGWDIHLFPVEDAGIHTDLRNVTIHDLFCYRPPGLDQSVRLVGSWPLSRSADLSKLSKFIVGRFALTLGDRTRRLARIISRLQPDIIHSLEIQHAGYLTLDAKNRLEGTFPTWIVTNWGSDIYLFGRLSEHVERIKATLSACDYYVCECHRDVGLARAFGFDGEVLPVLPNTGGFDIKRMQQYRQPGQTSARRLIVLKGYQHWAGRALVGIRAIELVADVLKDYQVAVYLARPDVRIAAELVSQSTGIPIEIIPYSSHEDMLQLHGRARISIGLSISDAISTSMLEAMVMGSFPIQSNTSCANEWIRDGETGLLVHPEDPEAVAAAIRRAVADDALVDRSADINTRLTSERLDRSAIQPQVIAMYEKVSAEAKQLRMNRIQR